MIQTVAHTRVALLAELFVGAVYFDVTDRVVRFDRGEGIVGYLDLCQRDRFEEC